MYHELRAPPARAHAVFCNPRRPTARSPALSIASRAQRSASRQPRANPFYRSASQFSTPHGGLSMPSERSASSHARSHGLCSRNTNLPREDLADAFHESCTRGIACAEWRLRRCLRIERPDSPNTTPIPPARRPELTSNCSTAPPSPWQPGIDMPNPISAPDPRSPVHVAPPQAACRAAAPARPAPHRIDNSKPVSAPGGCPQRVAPRSTAVRPAAGDRPPGQRRSTQRANRRRLRPAPASPRSTFVLPVLGSTSRPRRANLLIAVALASGDNRNRSRYICG